jgi:glycosyltransferase involved in cell wall biosynthesis
MLTLNASALLNGLLRFRPGDRVLVVTTPPLMPFAAAFAALLRGAAYTLLIHDNYPEILFAVGKARRGSLFARTLNFLNRSLYKYAAKIIVVARDMRDLVAAKAQGLNVPVVVIPNWAELETVSPQPRSENKLLAELGLIDKFVFLYAGNMGHPNDIQTLVTCAERLRDDPRIHFIFLGSGVKESWLRRTVEERGLANVTLLEPQPRSEQLVFLNACDVALVSLVRGMWGVSMPSRTYNILAAGKPMLALTDPGSEISQVIEEEGVGWAVAPDEPEILLAAINEALARRHELGVMSLNARNAALNKYSLSMAIEKYRSEID